jgi:hypothetical protein
MAGETCDGCDELVDAVGAWMARTWLQAAFSMQQARARH